MVLCPTQSSRLAKELIPTLTCLVDAPQYDWCGLVLDWLMKSVRNFSRRINNHVYAGGAGGCSIFLEIVYLDHLARAPLRWGQHPRVAMWSMEDIRNAKREDKSENGDYGFLGIIDVAYGERHPFEGRDTYTPASEAVEKMTSMECSLQKHHRGSMNYHLNRHCVCVCFDGGGGLYSDAARMDGLCSCPNRTNIYQDDIDLDLKLSAPLNQGFSCL